MIPKPKSPPPASGDLPPSATRSHAQSPITKESEELALLREENARLRAQLAIATAGYASAVQGAGASDQDPFDAQVADQKTLFSDFIEHLPIGLCLVGKGGKVLMSNPA